MRRCESEQQSQKTSHSVGSGAVSAVGGLRGALLGLPMHADRRADQLAPRRRRRLLLARGPAATRAAEGGALSTAGSAAERDTSSGSGAHGVLLRGAGLGLRLFFGVLRVDTMLLVRQQAR